ncbi:MAG: family 78 glycoside hydrolase catalytic domain [Victivallales bacterium]|jgi:alpha-L-rhamnosidase
MRTSYEKPERKWKAKWIGRPDALLNNWQRPVLPAPFFRKIFDYKGKTDNSKVHICGLGYYELYINGRKVGDHVLDPVVTHYDRRARYVAYDVAEYLVPGKNVFGVILGNGWYNCHTPEVWHFDKAPWRDYPKLLLELEIDGETILCSDESWKVSSGPILFDGLRNGETYDARLELDGWLLPDYDDSSWKIAANVSPPGGVLQQQLMPPCKVMKTFPVSKRWELPDGSIAFDIGQNITGWARITVSGKRGTELIIKYAETLNAGSDIDQTLIATFIKGGDCQTDRYILKGNDGSEIWEPRFTYHGFRYLRISGVSANVKIEKLEGRVVNTAFEQIGKFSCSDETLNRLQECTCWSYIGNFTGIPTDCPHREKNGWTGDAQLAAETGLFNFAAGTAYNEWMDSFADVQRPSGQLPGIVPSSGWGFNWGSGPAWDSAFLLIPWYVYLYTGDSSSIRTHYGSMKKYVDYCTGMATDHIVSFGLGDWCHVDRNRIAPVALTSTAYYYVDCILLSKFAAINGRISDQRKYAGLAEKIRVAFNRCFYKGDGIYASGEQTALGCAIYQGLVDASEKDNVVAKLADIVKANGCKPDFGILGAKYVLRALSDNGHVELAYKLITQPEFPGWAHWLKKGATTLWESWEGKSSLNHIMFGDISAWMYQYLAGIAPDPENPGFRHAIIKPHPVNGLEWVRAEYTSPSGKIVSAWKHYGGRFELEIGVPSSTAATVIMPDSSRHELHSGNHRFTVSINK